MTSTRKQKAKGKSLRLTDFFASNEQTDPSSHRADSVAPVAPPASSTLRVSPQPDATLLAMPLEERSSPPTYLSPSQHSTPKRGSTTLSPAKERSSSPVGEYLETLISDSSNVNSLAKHRAKMGNDNVAQLNMPLGAHSLLALAEDTLTTFPTTDQAVSESVLKEMMLALGSSIQQGFAAVLTKQTSVIEEAKMGEFAEAHNGLVDAHSHLEDDLASLTAKMADIEDRHRRNNVKFRDVPKSVPPSALSSYVQCLIKILLPSVTTHNLIIDRAHNLPKPKNSRM